MKRLIIYILITLAIGFVPPLLSFGNAYWPGDFFEQQIPFILETKRMLASGIPFWSWNTGLGCNFMGAYAFYTYTSPFVWINILFPAEHIGIGLCITLILKFIITGLLAFKYLRTTGIDKPLSQIGAMLFTFSSFIISNLYYYHFFEPVIGFLLLITGIESLLHQQRYARQRIAISSFLAAWLNFYFLLPTCLFCLMYLIIRVWNCNKYQVLRITMSATGYTLIGIMAASCILMPAILHLSGINRANPHFNIFYHYIMQIPGRTASIFLPRSTESSDGIYAIFGRFSSTAAYLPVVGASLWLPFAWKNRKNNKGMLIIIFLLIFLTPIQGVFSLFTSPTYNRWLYGFSLITSAATCMCLKNRTGISRKWTMIYCLITICTLCGLGICGILLGKNLKEPDFIQTTILTILNLLFLTLYMRRFNNNNILIAGIITTAGLQICSNIYIQNHKQNEYTHSNSEYIKTYLSTINSDNINTFNGKRTEYITPYSNIGLLTNTPSTHTFISTYGKTPYRLYNLYPGNKPKNNSVKFNKFQDSFYTLLSVRNIMLYTRSIELPDTTKFIKQNEDESTITFLNRHYIPVGTAYNSYITEPELLSAMKTDSTFNAANVMLKSLVINPDDEITLSRYMKKSVPNDNIDLDSISKAKRETAVSSFCGDSQGFRAKFTANRAATLFFSIPHDPGFTAYIDNSPTEIYDVNFGLMAIIVPSGNHDIEFRYIPPGLKTGLAFSALGIALIIITSVSEHRKTSRQKSI